MHTAPNYPFLIFNFQLYMQRSLQKEIGVFGSLGSKLTDFALLVKFKLNLTVVFSSVMALLIAATEPVSWLAILLFGVGGFLITGAANALNQVLERDFDKLMKRTANRPLAAERMTVSTAVLTAGLMCLIGTFCLSAFNAWAGLLGMLSMVLYAFVYTPMKRVSPSAVVVGAIPGALPLMIGCVAVEGYVSGLAIALFAIQFFWQFPHFFAIAWVGDEDYKKAGFHLLPNKTGALNESVGMQSFIYALFLIPVGVLPYALGITGIPSLIIISLSSLLYAGFGWNLYKKCTRKAALQLMFSSFFYLPLVLFALYFNKLI